MNRREPLCGILQNRTQTFFSYRKPFRVSLLILIVLAASAVALKPFSSFAEAFSREEFVSARDLPARSAEYTVTIVARRSPFAASSVQNERHRRIRLGLFPHEDTSAPGLHRIARL
jgi:hypothetical protein